MPVGALVATATALVVIWFVIPLRDGTAELGCQTSDGLALREGAWIQAATAKPTVLTFSDGSQMILSEHGRAQVQQLQAHTVAVKLTSGRLRSSIEQQGKTTWRVQAGGYQILVVGTVFVTDWQQHSNQLAVQCDRGVVQVSGERLGAGGMFVRAGQRAEIRPDQVTLVDVRAALPQAVVDAGSDGAALPKSVRQVRRETSPTRLTPAILEEWRTLATAGHYVAAMALARKTGIPRLLALSTPDDRLLFADMARLAGDAGLARRVLLELRHPQHAEVQSEAAFRLGRLAWDSKRDYRAAAHWYELFLAEQPQSRLAPHAQGRLLIAYHALGQLARAQEVSRRYLQDHPDGPYAAAAQDVLSGRTPSQLLGQPQ